eukprot:2835657-Amphidinium_carterae.1
MSWRELSPSPPRVRKRARRAGACPENEVSRNDDVTSVEASLRSDTESDSNHDENDGIADPGDALQAVTEMLIQHQQEKKVVTAAFVVSLCYHLTDLGVSGLEDLAMKPTAATGGNPQKKIDRSCPKMGKSSLVVIPKKVRVKVDVAFAT